VVNEERSSTRQKDLDELIESHNQELRRQWGLPHQTDKVDLSNRKDSYAAVDKLIQDLKDAGLRDKDETSMQRESL
jgi:hypothetical protein